MGFGNFRRFGGVRQRSITYAARRPKRIERVFKSVLYPAAEILETRAYLTVTLAPASDFPGVTSPAGIAVADVNADGVADVEVAGINPTTSLPSVGVYLGGATPVFYDLTGDNSAQDITTADFNGDGNTDIAVTDPVDATVSVLLGNGDGTFQAPITTGYGTAPSAGATPSAYLVAADFNGDGMTDLAVTDPADHQVSILLGTGTGSFTLGTPITSTDPAFAPLHIATADFNGDGFADLVYSDAAAAQVSVALGNNDGTFATSTITPVDGVVQGLVTDDLNTDGQTDIAVSLTNDAVSGSGEIELLFNSSATFTSVAEATTFSNPGPIATGDIDGDGLTDIVAMNASGALDFLAGTGDGAFAPAIESQATSGTPQAMVTDDVTGDGKADILFSEVNAAITGGGGFGLVVGPASPEVSATITGVLPASAISGQKTAIVQTVKLTNVSGAPISSGVALSVALSSDDSYSADDTVIDSITTKGKIGTGKTKSQRLKITSIPDTVTAGSYFVVVQATDSSGGIATAGSSATINVAAPEVDVAGAFKKAPATAKAAKHLPASIVVTNEGNVPITGMLPIDVDTSATNMLDDTAVNISSKSRKLLNLKPGKSVTISLTGLIAPSTAGAYFLIVQLDAGNTLGDANTANNVFATSAGIAVD
ncbi:MAG TPA: VCBS repeat-containing protein [Tepidisphaeraceae bacterium]|jgi:hypothetical protein|nr:VCBS repeat-containing protein [Tepidisphaeraceae bacterium]